MSALLQAELIATLLGLVLAVGAMMILRRCAEWLWERWLNWRANRNRRLLFTNPKHWNKL